MGRKNRTQIIRERNRGKQYRSKNRKRPRGWRRGGRPLWAVWLTLENEKREAKER